MRDQFHEIQIALQTHLQTLNLSVGVLSGGEAWQESLKIIEQVNGEALKSTSMSFAKTRISCKVTSGTYSKTRAPLTTTSVTY